VAGRRSPEAHTVLERLVPFRSSRTPQGHILTTWKGAWMANLVEALADARPERLRLRRSRPVIRGRPGVMLYTLALIAAGCFTAGGLLTKPADGLRRMWPTVAVLALFALGAACLTLVVHRGGEVGPPYLVVVGLEAVLAFVLAAVFFHEQVTLTRTFAVLLVLGGTVLLARPGG
jgi:multidrug transporter EmrE-like cation transporter